MKYSGCRVIANKIQVTFWSIHKVNEILISLVFLKLFKIEFYKSANNEIGYWVW